MMPWFLVHCYPEKMSLQHMLNCQLRVNGRGQVVPDGRQGIGEASMDDERSMDRSV